MTQDEIIEITKRSGLSMLLEVGGMDKCLEHFAKLVAAHEREQIEKLFEELSDNTEPHKDYEDYDDGWRDACNACKWAITDRGEQQ